MISVDLLDRIYDELILVLRDAPADRETGARSFAANLRGILVGQPGSKFYRTPPAGGSDTVLTQRQAADLLSRGHMECSRVANRWERLT